MTKRRGQKDKACLNSIDNDNCVLHGNMSLQFLSNPLHGSFKYLDLVTLDYWITFWFVKKYHPSVSSLSSTYNQSDAWYNIKSQLNRTDSSVSVTGVKQAVCISCKQLALNRGGGLKHQVSVIQNAVLRTPPGNSSHTPISTQQAS